MEQKKHYTISIPVRSFWTLYLPIAFGACFIAFIAGIVVIDAFVMPRIVGIDRGMVVVPDVKGLALEEGREKLFKAGLLTEIKSREYDSKLPLDAIINQAPEPGEKVKKSRRILVVVSKGEEFAVVPDIENMTERQARNEFKKTGFTIGDVKKIWDEKHDKDLVIHAYPAERTTISRDMKVDIILSKGPKPTSAEMPNIVGETLADAKKKMEECGLKIGTMHYKNDHSLLPGTVISQSIPPGENVPFEKAVTITVSVIH
jgi:eukaryotic-like serine/threonine-protein kinase